MTQPYQIDITVNGEVLTALADTPGEAFHRIRDWMNDLTIAEIDNGFTIKLSKAEPLWEGQFEEEGA